MRVTCYSSGRWSGSPQCQCDEGYRDVTVAGRQSCAGNQVYKQFNRFFKFVKTSAKNDMYNFSAPIPATVCVRVFSYSRATIFPLL